MAPSSSPQPSQFHDDLAERDDDRDDVDQELGHGTRPGVSTVALSPRAVALSRRAGAAAVDLERECGTLLDELLDLVARSRARPGPRAPRPPRAEPALRR